MQLTGGKRWHICPPDVPTSHGDVDAFATDEELRSTYPEFVAARGQCDAFVSGIVLVLKL